MLGIISPSNSPYHNLAAEEYLMRKFREDIFMLYRNTDSIVVGKHQNTMGEINLHYLKEKNIPVVRRLSGGGTVYHDLKNLNFSFIKTGELGKLVDFKKFVAPIIEFLLTKGIEAEAGSRHDILVNGKKFSGNAEHVFKDRILHHGTLLFESNLHALSRSIQVELDHFTDKSVKSNRSTVMNLKQLLPDSLSVEQFTSDLFEFLSQKYSNVIKYSFNEADLSAIDRLVEEKYKTWEWNFAYSPKYLFQKKSTIDGYSLFLKATFEKARLRDLQIETEHPLFEEFNTYLHLFKGIRHDPSDFEEILISHDLEMISAKIDVKALVNCYY
jgi:lipoate---protein ligase